MKTEEYFELLPTQNDLTEANQRLTEWLIFYKFEPPHQTLKYKKLIEWDNNYKLRKVLPIYPTLTLT